MAASKEWGEGGGDAKDALKKPIAGMPAWAWAFLFAALFIAYMVYRNRKASAAAVPANAGAGDALNPANSQFDPNAIDPMTGLQYSQEMAAGYGLPAGALGQYLSANPTNAAYPTGLTMQGLPGPITNLQWARIAGDELIALGDDPSLVNNALTKMLSGTGLSTQEQAVVNVAEERFGLPPEGVLPSTPAPPPTQKQQDWYYTVHPGDTWQSIAKIAFPNATPDEQAAAASALASQNQQASMPTLGGQPGPNSLIRVGSLQDWVNAGFKATLNPQGNGYTVTNTGRETTVPWGTGQ